ncbi:hypothetical protein GCM10011371_06790 [Novosphingobium marinum]|uniref:Tetratricopeptide (TPR) repeat protein n=1 Tax=Novosphingobium marinum TaxID=1514948 RepID=A0A7Y9XTX3_9SPHN|nr:hypothetical protein [Novosphingobium marinum]NYH94367.1 tetratricopeptide (TPR) repeat protein [Novosphingobium marinum]GGC21804.1 hypothetical protein GCM10011371_06790 [Novosphingobium marinum]
MKFSRVALAAIALFSASSARAEWMEATSDHFVIYADESERKLRAFAEKLERYNSAMAFVTKTKSTKPTPSNRVTIYVVGSGQAVRKLHGSGSSFVNGFYIPRAGGSIAIVPEVEDSRRELTFSMVTLLHEYAHHFTRSVTSFPMPRWMGEGSAEFFSSAKFEKDDSVWLGRPATHRAGELLYAKDVSVEELLDPAVYAKNKRNSRLYDAFYGRSWLLYHYLVFDESRKGQLDTYSRLLAGGAEPLAAAEQAFGNIQQLEDDLDSYYKQRRMPAFKLSADRLQPGPINVRPLREGEAEMMPVRIRSRRGVDEETAKDVLADARKVASAYPSDPMVLTALAEAEHDAGNDELAVAAADKALALDPRQTDAYVQKGFALFRIAENTEGDERKAAFERVRKVFVALNRLENDHPLPLIYYYRSFAAEGVNVPDIAKQGLARASQLAPFDLGLHMQLAQMYANEFKFDFARAHLRPVAFNPHGGSLAEAAEAMLEEIEVAEPAPNSAGASIGVAKEAQGGS